jgi:hypothetical protein
MNAQFEWIREWKSILNCPSSGSRRFVIATILRRLSRNSIVIERDRSGEFQCAGNDPLKFLKGKDPLIISILLDPDFKRSSVTFANQ